MLSPPHHQQNRPSYLAPNQTTNHQSQGKEGEKKKAHLNQLLRQPKARAVLLLLRQVERTAPPEPSKAHVLEDLIEHGVRRLGVGARKLGVRRQRLEQGVRGLERARGLAVQQDVFEDGGYGGASVCILLVNCCNRVEDNKMGKK